MTVNLKDILVLSSIFPPDTGGVPNYYKNLLMNSVHFDYTVLTNLTKDCGQLNNDLLNNSHITLLRDSLYPANIGMHISIHWTIYLVKLISTILKLSKQVRFKFVIVGQAALFVVLAAYIVKLLTGIPYILFFHGEEIPQLQLKSNPVLRFLFKRAYDYFCNSSFTHHRVKSFLSDDSFLSTRIYPGVEDRFFEMIDSAPKRKSFCLEGKRVIYTIARLDERKGQDMAIEALPKVLKRFPNAVYLLGGVGPRLEFLKDLVESKCLGEHVRFLGMVPEEELVAYHRLGEIFLHPNRTLKDGDTEGFGIVFLEANAVGNPVIGGRAGGAVEAVVDGVTGFLVDPDDPDDIAEKLCFLLEKKNEAERMGTNGRDRAWNQFRWHGLALEFEKALMKMCARYEHLNSKPNARIHGIRL